MPKTSSRRWCFADQLGPHFLDKPDQPVLLIESRAAFTRRRFHRRKAHLVLSALRHRAAELGDQAVFLQARTYGEALGTVEDDLSVCQPTSWAAEQFVRSLPSVDVLPARGFCTSRAAFPVTGSGNPGHLPGPAPAGLEIGDLEGQCHAHRRPDFARRVQAQLAVGRIKLAAAYRGSPSRPGIQVDQ